MHTGDGRRYGQHLSLGVAEDDCLGDGEGVVQVAQRVKLPLLLLHRNKELLDALHRRNTPELSAAYFARGVKELLKSPSSLYPRCKV